MGGSGTERAEPRRFAQAMQVVVGDSKASAQAEAITPPVTSPLASPVQTLVEGRSEARGAPGGCGELEGVGQADEPAFAPGPAEER